MSARPEDAPRFKAAPWEADEYVVTVNGAPIGRTLWKALAFGIAEWLNGTWTELRAISGAAPPRGDRAYYDAASIYRELEVEDFSLAPSLDILEKALRAGRAAVPDEPPPFDWAFHEESGEPPEPPVAEPSEREQRKELALAINEHLQRRHGGTGYYPVATDAAHAVWPFYARLAEENRTLQEAVRKYGSHLRGCGFPDCDCGLDALAGVPQEKAP